MPAVPGALSEWLQLMLAEIAAKRADLAHACAEETRRESERSAPQPAQERGSASRS